MIAIKKALYMTVPLLTAMTSCVQANDDTSSGTFTIGLGGHCTPRYSGSDKQVWQVVPVLQGRNGAFFIDTQKGVGYDLQNAIREELLNRGINRPVATILTQVVVNPYDDSFYKPVKVIGRIMTKEEADAEEEKGNYVVKVDGGYRRIVSAPKPEDIVEIDSIRALSDAGQVVIACGGGGIPVLKQANRLKGASAVIEKDLASGKLAELLDADVLLLLTGEKKLYLNYGKDNCEPLDTISVDKARSYIAEGQFAETSILPKVVAAVSFVSGKPGRVTVIADLDDAKAALEEKAGTIIK